MEVRIGEKMGEDASDAEAEATRRSGWLLIHTLQYKTKVCHSSVVCRKGM